MKKFRLIFIVIAIVVAIIITVAVLLTLHILLNKEEIIFIYMLYDHIEYNGNDYYISNDQHYSPSNEGEKRGLVYLIYKSSKINYEKCNYAYVYTGYEGEEEEIYLFFDSAEWIRGDYLDKPND